VEWIVALLLEASDLDSVVWNPDLPDVLLSSPATCCSGSLVLFVSVTWSGAHQRLPCFLFQFRVLCFVAPALFLVSVACQKCLQSPFIYTTCFHLYYCLKLLDFSCINA
jgi:hypothetical protein